MADPGAGGVIVEEEEVPVRPPNPLNDISASITSVGLLAKRVLSAAGGSSDASKVNEDAEQLALSMLLSVHNLQMKPKNLPYKVKEKDLAEMTQAAEKVYAAVVCLMEMAIRYGATGAGGGRSDEEKQELIQHAYDGVTDSIDMILEVINKIEEEDGEEGEEELKKKGEATGGEGGYNMAEIQNQAGLAFILKLAGHVATMISSLPEDHKLSPEEVLEKAKEREGAVSMLLTLSRKFARCRSDGAEQKLLLEAATKTKAASTEVLAAQKAVLRFLTKAKTKPKAKTKKTKTKTKTKIKNKKQKIKKQKNKKQKTKNKKNKKQNKSSQPLPNSFFFSLLASSRPDGKPDNSDFIAVADAFSQSLLKLLQLLIQIKNSDVKTSHRLFIWDEADGGNITMEGGSVSTGSLNQLIIRLTSPGAQDHEFKDIFIATFPTFTNADEFFTKLLQRYSIPRRKYPNLPYKKWKDMTVVPIQEKVIAVLHAWVAERFTDFTYSLIKQLNEFLEYRMFPDGYRESGQQILMLVQQNIEALHKAYIPIVPPLQPGFNSSEYLLELGQKALGEQLALREFSDFKRIQPSEFLDLSWKNPKLKHRSPNITKILEQNQILSTWVSNVVVTTVSLKKRVDVYSKLVNLAQNSFSLHNYSSCKAIVLGLCDPAIDRLKFTKSQAPAQVRSTLAALQERLRPEDRHSNLQKIMRSDKPPVVPYLPVLLENLAMIEEANADKVGNLINFKKRSECYQVLKEIKRYQTAEVPISVNEQARSVLENLTAVGGNFLYEESLAREGRGKQLKELVQ